MNHFPLAIPVICAAAFLFPLSFQGNQASDHPLLHDLIDDYRVTIAVAQACLDRNPDSELLALCKTSSQNLRSEAAQLESWSEQWYQTQIAEHRDLKKEPAVKAVLKAKSSKANSVIREQMAKQYRVLLDRLVGCKQTASHGQLTEFCKTEFVSIQAELSQVVR
jgi:hypothetical protein